VGVPRTRDERGALRFRAALGVLLLVPSLGSGCVITLHPGASQGGPTGGIITGSPPAGSWVNVTANLAGMPSECGNMSSVFVKPDENLVIAGIAQDGLWGSRDDGTSWQALSTGLASATITNRPSSLVYDPLTPSQYWESGAYNGGGVYETMDDGVTFTQLGDVTDSDLVSVDLTDPKRQTLLAGGHEAAQTLYRSTDGGMTWTNVGADLPASTDCTFPLVIDAQTYLVGCGGKNGGTADDGGVEQGIYRTIDAGTTWVPVTTSGGGSAPLMTDDGTIYWASPNDGGMTMSMDKGMTWKNVVNTPYTIKNVHPVEVSKSTIATLGQQYVVTSSDHGMTWNIASPLLPWTDDDGGTQGPVGVVYSSHENAFYVWGQTCGFPPPIPVPADAIMKYVIAGGADD
jgi:hypothetical protein